MHYKIAQIIVLFMTLDPQVDDVDLQCFTCSNINKIEQSIWLFNLYVKIRIINIGMAIDYSVDVVTLDILGNGSSRNATVV